METSNSFEELERNLIITGKTEDVFYDITIPNRIEEENLKLFIKEALSSATPYSVDVQISRNKEGSIDVTVVLMVPFSDTILEEFRGKNYLAYNRSDDFVLYTFKQKNGWKNFLKSLDAFNIGDFKIGSTKISGIPEDMAKQYGELTLFTRRDQIAIVTN